MLEIYGVFSTTETRYIRRRRLDDLDCLMLMDKGHQRDRLPLVDLVKKTVSEAAARQSTDLTTSISCSLVSENMDCQMESPNTSLAAEPGGDVDPEIVLRFTDTFLHHFP